MTQYSLPEEETKICRDCNRAIEYLADFPGPRCLACHAKKVGNEPLERPNFMRALNVGKRRAR